MMKVVAGAQQDNNINHNNINNNNNDYDDDDANNDDDNNNNTNNNSIINNNNFNHSAGLPAGLGLRGDTLRRGLLPPLSWGEAGLASSPCMRLPKPSTPALCRQDTSLPWRPGDGGYHKELSRCRSGSQTEGCSFWGHCFQTTFDEILGNPPKPAQNHPGMPESSPPRKARPIAAYRRDSPLLGGRSPRKNIEKTPEKVISSKTLAR